jgi:hypothetical protein
VLNRALRQCHEWQGIGLELGMAVNLSARSLHDPHLATTIADSLETWGFRSDLLVLELEARAGEGCAVGSEPALNDEDYFSHVGEILCALVTGRA